MSELVVRFEVPGTAVPQGSMSAYVIKGTNRAVVTDQKRAQLKPWRAAVAAAARDARSGAPIVGPLLLVADFKLVRPKSVKRDYPAVRPDLSKLVRALEDGITDAGTIWRDDAQVVEAVVSKIYADTASTYVAVHAL